MFVWHCKIAPSSFGEDYQTGDIVTYYRPYSRVSRAHIAIVTGEIGPSGNPMIVHNRGYGAKEVERFLYHDGGLKGLSGVSNDMRDLEESRDPAAAFASRLHERIGRRCRRLRPVGGAGARRGDPDRCGGPDHRRGEGRRYRRTDARLFRPP